MVRMNRQESEEIVRQLWKSDAAFFWECSLPDRRVRFSEQAKGVIGRDADSLEGELDRFFAIIPPEDQTKILGRLDAVAQGVKRRFRCCHRVMLPGGGFRWIVASGRPVSWDADGKPSSLAGTGMDVTALRNVRSALRVMESDIVSLVHSVGDCVFVLDRSGRILDTNEAVHCFVGADRASLRGRRLESIVHPEGHASVERLLRESRVREWQEELPIAAAEGAPRYLEVRMIAGVWGNRSVFVGVGRDVTRRREAEAGLRWRIEFEKLIASLSSTFMFADDFARAVDRALADIGRFYGAKRVSLHLFGDVRDARCVSEWLDEGMPSFRDHATLPDESFEAVLAKILRNGSLILPDVSAMPPSPERTLLIRLETASMLCVLVFAGKEPAGVVCLSSRMQAKTWSEQDLPMLRIFSDILGNALVRESERKRLREDEQRLTMAIVAGDSLLFEWNVPSDTIRVLRGGGLAGGRPLQDRVYSMSEWRRRIHPEDRERVWTKLQAHLDGHVDDEGYETEYRSNIAADFASGDPAWLWLHSRGRVMERDEAGKAVRVMGIIMDISRRKAVEEERGALLDRLRVAAETDVLTGLRNRQTFERDLRRAIVADQGEGSAFCLVMFDLDDFKIINDTRGHVAGDGVLSYLSGSIRKHIRECDAFYRWGGDEFAVFVRGTPDDAMALARRTLDLIRSLPKEHAGGIGASFGIACHEPNESAEDLLRRVDRAMYAAKRNGGSRIEFA